eukprot:CAMPEP_0172167066 /NCGR_PEP_ID=MMETSP1050-20130122/9358_1 /TAXON_ID=233186 /ORGANISM="Cryptomonas curvata, Strain CCAP979/52" /LENGTH=1252 /DNA_ID=CAMNT_0012837801 /DNA_START=118 /DNA_END=3876 /DNA_ORIENTATION=+
MASSREEVSKNWAVFTSELASVAGLVMGRLAPKDGFRYEGEIDRIGIPSGQGILTYPDGCRYEGHFKKHKPTDPATKAVEITLFGAKRHGMGTLTWADGSRYEGDWAENSIHGIGVMSWPNGQRFSGSFSCNSPEKGTLEAPSGSWNVTYEEKVNLLERQELPEPKSRREIGRISVTLWAAITDSAAESYGALKPSDLSFADRVLVKSLHTGEKSFKLNERAALSVVYQSGPGAAEQILRSFTGEAESSRATQIQWAIVPKPALAEVSAERTEVDSVESMLRIAGGNLPGFRLTSGGSLQPDPLSIIDDIKPSLVAAGRLVGAALWHGKTFEIPFARFFCRRVLEMVKKERLRAFSVESMNLQSSEILKYHTMFPLNGTFPIHLTSNSSCFGQPVRVTKLLPPPIFFNTKSDESRCLEELEKDLILQEAESIGPKPGFLELLVLQGKMKHCVSCPPDAMVLVLKHQLQKATGVSPTNQNLIFKGKQLQDKHLVSTTGLKAGDKILLMITSEGLKELKEKANKATQKLPLGFDVDTLLVGTNPWSCSPGMCFLPKWVLDELGVIEGEEVEVEALQPPFNKRGHTISRALDDSYPKGAGSLNTALCDLRVTAEWYCGRSKKTAGGQELVCCPPRACQDCRQVIAPCLKGGLEHAIKILWRLVIEPVDKDGKFENFMECGPKALLENSNLQCIQIGMCIPLKWESDKDQVDAESIALLCEGIMDGAGKILSEAVLTLDTEHSFSRDRVDHERIHSTRSGADLWKKLALAVKTSSRLMSISDDAFLMGEMVSDYLEQAASDDADRKMIRSNEFGWLLKNDITALADEGTLPPRFEGLAGDNAPSSKRQLSISKDDLQAKRVLKRRLSKQLLDSESTSKLDSEFDNSSGADKELAIAPNEGIFSVLPSSVVASDFDDIDADKDGFCNLEDLEIVLLRKNWRKEQIHRLFRAIDTNSDGKISREEFKTYAVGRRSSRRRLVRLWLKRKLYEEVQEQVFAFSRGLREVVPVGLLSLFSAPELQCLLGGGSSVDDLTLEDWKYHCEYDLETRENGLEKSNIRVLWFWEALETMSPADRADVWRYATGKRQPPKQSEGGCGLLVPKFSLVALESSDKINDRAMVKAATCYHQLQLPCYSSAQITAQQLKRSVQEGLSSPEDASNFEETQRRLLAQVHQRARQVSNQGGMTQEILRGLFPNSYMCAQCNFGPVEHLYCANLRSHHGEERGAGRISNACPKCGWFSPQISDWPLWNGRLWPAD